MTINTYSPATGAFVAPPARGSSGVILVATDGSAASEVALTAAEMIARRVGVPVETVTAVEPLAMPPSFPGTLVIPAEVERTVLAERRDRAETQARRHADGGRPWPAHVELGGAAEVIGRVATERGAGLVLAGFGRHSLLMRMVGTETPLKVARRVDAPVLCVPAGFARLPRTVVVAVDTGSECVRAAAAARPLLAETTRVFLVHVKARDRLDVPASVLSEWERSYETELRDAFTRVTESLGLPPDVDVTTVVLRGTPATELLGFATSAEAELLVAGHGHRRPLERLVGGSVASRLFRGAQCALLLAPDVTPLATIRDAPETVTEVFEHRMHWPMELVRFTARNTGRPATLEVDDARLGAQLVAHRYPFLGADYDWRDDAVELSFGDPGARRGHLTHVVKDATSVSIQRGPGPNDRSLRVAREDGQVLVLLE